MFRQVVTNFGEEHVSVFRVEELTKIGNWRFLQKVGVTLPNYMVSHLSVMFPNIVAADSVIALKFILQLTELFNSTPLNRMNEGLLHALAKGLGFQFWA